jgi:hypothetical protein
MMTMGRHHSSRLVASLLVALSLVPPHPTAKLGAAPTLLVAVTLAALGTLLETASVPAALQGGLPAALQGGLPAALLVGVALLVATVVHPMLLAAPSVGRCGSSWRWVVSCTV